MAINYHNLLFLYLKPDTHGSFIACGSHSPGLNFTKLQTFRLYKIHDSILEVDSDVAANHGLVSVDQLLIK
jgi:hypothetical protein